MWPNSQSQPSQGFGSGIAPAPARGAVQPSGQGFGSGVLRNSTFGLQTYQAPTGGFGSGAGGVGFGAGMQQNPQDNPGRGQFGGGFSTGQGSGFGTGQKSQVNYSQGSQNQQQHKYQTRQQTQLQQNMGAQQVNSQRYNYSQPANQANTYQILGKVIPANNQGAAQGFQQNMPVLPQIRNNDQQSMQSFQPQQQQQLGLIPRQKPQQPSQNLPLNIQPIEMQSSSQPNIKLDDSFGHPCALSEKVQPMDENDISKSISIFPGAFKVVHLTKEQQRQVNRIKNGPNFDCHPIMLQRKDIDFVTGSPQPTSGKGSLSDPFRQYGFEPAALNIRRLPDGLSRQKNNSSQRTPFAQKLVNYLPKDTDCM